jgi:dTDP-4-dehydrorhamnose 3,5-epimerase
MRLEPFGLEGAFKVHLEPHRDERGYFARTFSVDSFAAEGIAFEIVETSVSWTAQKGTLRGMHHQADPHGEAKSIRCDRGRVFDAAIDLRPESPTYRRAAWTELAADEPVALYLPSGLAHGFLTLTDDVLLSYQMSSPYVPDSARGIRWNDPSFPIPWPGAVEIVSERDQNHPDFAP